MLASRRTATVAVTTVVLALLASAPSVPAASPATVTVRVEGAIETKLPPTQVTTATAPVVKDGNPAHACPGASAAGALELATGGSWSGKWFGGEIKEGHFEGLGYSVETVLAELHTFGSGEFWDEWVDNHEGLGLCHDEPQPGGQVLLFPCPETGECPTPLAIEAPPSASVGEPVPVTVKRYSSKGEVSPAAAAIVTGGVAPAMTDGGGHATLTFARAGHSTVGASAPQSVRTETTVCVHAGNDGSCETTLPTSAPGSSPSSRSPSSGAAATYRGPYAVVANILGLSEHHTYSRRRAPRVLRGSVSAHTTVTSVSIALRRRSRNHCFAYSGLRALFVRATCGTAAFFQVGSSPSFSYLLPAPLGPGRYVLDVEATDAAGNRTTLARGSSRIVFYVR
jgi:hypothetical protein